MGSVGLVMKMKRMKRKRSEKLLFFMGRRGIDFHSVYNECGEWFGVSFS